MRGGRRGAGVQSAKNLGGGEEGRGAREGVYVRQEGTLYWLLNFLFTYWFISEVLPTLPSQTPRKNASEPRLIPLIRCCSARSQTHAGSHHTAPAGLSKGAQLLKMA